MAHISSTSGASTSARDSASDGEIEIIEMFSVPTISHVTTTEAAFLLEQNNNS